MSNENKSELRNCKELAEIFKDLVEKNHDLKTAYEELQMRYERLDGEKRRVEDEERGSKVRINELKKQQTLLEDEIARLAVYNQQGNNDGQSRSEEQCEILKSQIIAYKDDFERERADRENLQEDKEKVKHQLEDAEDIIKQLTTELDFRKAWEEAERERRYSETDVQDLITDAL